MRNTIFWQSWLEICMQHQAAVLVKSLALCTQFAAYYYFSGKVRGVLVVFQLLCTMT